jgi:hypothetical protein
MTNRIFSKSEQTAMKRLSARQIGSDINLSPYERYIAYIYAHDADIWRTGEEGHHFKFDDKTGIIKAGFGGKFNGQTIKSASGKPKKQLVLSENEMPCRDCQHSKGKYSVCEAYPERKPYYVMEGKRCPKKVRR